MDEMDLLRQNRINELQQQAEMQQQVQQLETIVKTILTKEALSRYGNLKIAHPEKAIQVLAIIGQMIQKGQTKQINDEELKKMLIMIQPKQKQFKITRR